MADSDKQISALVAASNIGTSDLLVCEQGGIAKKIAGAVLRKLGVDVDASMTATEYNNLADLLGLTDSVSMGNPNNGGSEG